MGPQATSPPQPLTLCSTPQAWRCHGLTLSPIWRKSPSLQQSSGVQSARIPLELVLRTLAAPTARVAAPPEAQRQKSRAVETVSRLLSMGLSVQWLPWPLSLVLRLSCCLLVASGLCARTSWHLLRLPSMVVHPRLEEMHGEHPSERGDTRTLENKVERACSLEGEETSMDSCSPKQLMTIYEDYERSIKSFTVVQDVSYGHKSCSIVP